MSLRAGLSPELPGRLVVSLRVHVDWSHDLDLNCTKGNPRWPLIRLPRCVLGIFPQLGRNRFESPSLLDSENLTGVRLIIEIDGSVGYEIMKELNLTWLLLY